MSHAANRFGETNTRNNGIFPHNYFLKLSVFSKTNEREKRISTERESGRGRKRVETRY